MSMELMVVIPVYNEEDCIIEVLQSWLSELSELNIDFGILALNDGSRDATSEKLNFLANHAHIQVIHKPNSGHGPTILEGYLQAVMESEWVFQCDSDNEMEARHFASLWQLRDHYDAIVGIRSSRVQSRWRKLISKCSRITVKALFGSGVTDVNCPFRLMRSEILGPIIQRLPRDTFAPNVIISGALARGQARICNVPIPHHNRRTGQVSIMKWRLWKAAFRSLAQTVHWRLSIPELGISVPQPDLVKNRAA